MVETISLGFMANVANQFCVFSCICDLHEAYLWILQVLQAHLAKFIS